MFPLSMTMASPAVAGVLAVVHVLLAGFVTADVLLKKSDVRAALGWIAVAWFSPILGSLFYYLFGINRVTRRALRLGRPDDPRPWAPGVCPPPSASPNVALLSELSGRVTGSPLTQGNAFTILENGDAAYPPMLEAIAGAKHFVVLASYIFRNDASGKAFARALIDARKRGVEVRVLLDGVGIGYVLPLILFRLCAAGCAPPAFCTPGCPGACRFSTCAITASCWWWMAGWALSAG